ncbi:MAG: hypothetical protein MJY96_07710 [Bacteroidaceae bacterium]|nr:hypothetical protein [Bacteroidaceae bacterium]
MTEQELQHSRDRQYLIECLSSDLIQMLMEEEKIPMEDAMHIIYNSDTYRKLEDEKTGLYYQSSVYVMDYLKEELSKAQNQF